MDAQGAVGGSRDFPEEPSGETFERLSGLTDFTESGFRAQSRFWEKKIFLNKDKNDLFKHSFVKATKFRPLE